MCISSAGRSVLIDVGKSAKQMELALRNNDIDVSSIDAIFITHEHSDHVQGLKIFAKKYKIKVYASSGTIRALEYRDILSDSIDYTVIDESGVRINDIEIKPFRTSHDCAEGFGYVVHTPDERSVAVATDLGYMSDEVRDLISKCDVVVIESNHDINMLQCGEYPYYLKRRILSDEGHLSNEACANELPDLVRSGVSRFVLAHLSKENNIPELAYETAVAKLSAAGFVQGKDYELMVAPVTNVERKMVLF